MAENVRLRIGSLAKAVLVTGQAYQDPKDALNEFVSNAADEYAESDRRGGRIRVVLRRKGRYPVIAVDDEGRGMGPDRLKAVARSLFDSTKVGDDRTLGEKAIGVLAFQQLGGRCEIVSRAEGSAETWCLRIERGKATAKLSQERRRARDTAGTTVYLADLDPDVLRMLTKRKVVDYLRKRRAPALAAGAYEIEVVEGKKTELVTPEAPEGVKLDVPARQTLWGRIEFHLYVTAEASPGHRVAVVGRAGTTIVDDVAELDEFSDEPWSSGRVSGHVAFDGLQQTAGRRGVLRDREAWPVFVDAMRAVEPAVVRTLERVARELDEQTADRLAETVRKVFGRVLRELADLDNPMRTPLGSQPGEGGLLEAEPSGNGDPSREPTDPAEPEHDRTPDLSELTPTARDPIEPPDAPPTARPQRSRSSRLPTVAPDPEPGEARSRYDPESNLVFYNERHPDYLMVKDAEAALLDYLATLVAKEYVVYNNPRAAAEELAEEMVRMVVRVRRHLPRVK